MTKEDSEKTKAKRPVFRSRSWKSIIACFPKNPHNRVPRQKEKRSESTEKPKGSVNYSISLKDPRSKTSAELNPPPVPSKSLKNQNPTNVFPEASKIQTKIVLLNSPKNEQPNDSSFKNLIKMRKMSPTIRSPKTFVPVSKKSTEVSNTNHRAENSPKKQKSEKKTLSQLLGADSLISPELRKSRSHSASENTNPSNSTHSRTNKLEPTSARLNNSEISIESNKTNLSNWDNDFVNNSTLNDQFIIGKSTDFNTSLNQSNGLKGNLLADTNYFSNSQKLKPTNRVSETIEADLNKARAKIIKVFKLTKGPSFEPVNNDSSSSLRTLGEKEPSPEEEDLWESWRQIEAFIIFCGNKRYSAINGSSISFVNQLSSCFVDRFQQDHYIKLLWSKIYTKSDDLDEKEGKYEYLGLQNGIQRNSNPVSVDKARENYLNNRNNLNFIRTTSNESNITINLNGSFERVQIGRQFGPKGEALYGKKQFRFDDSMTNKKPIVYTPKITMKEIKNLNRVSKAILAEFRTNLLKYIRSLNTT
ncbi:hypothetical protein BB560_002249 [Smittium megazygosporum]|uniref:Uncharacterized protein n=1 Tax=Smittium megazygosporum TaxID=133381 RepID=A0A2T9ZFC9_9FUNG|nr:hypothetical protein BB560_002249 [Smittium megazygosporum]